MAQKTALEGVLGSFQLLQEQPYDQAFQAMVSAHARYEASGRSPRAALDLCRAVMAVGDLGDAMALAVECLPVSDFRSEARFLLATCKALLAHRVLGLSVNPGGDQTGTLKPAELLIEESEQELSLLLAGQPDDLDGLALQAELAELRLHL